MQILFGAALLVLLHICVWFSINAQFVKQWADQINPLWLALGLSIPTTLFSYYGSKLLYYSLHESAWSVRFIGFGVSYLVFPILTWIFLGESMLEKKTLVCIFLSVVILYIQLTWR